MGKLLDLLIGTWHLVSVEVRYEGEQALYPWGEQPIGHLIYTEDGYMSAVISRSSRPPFAVNDLLQGSMEEQAQAARDYLSYGGSYRLEGEQVTHYVEVSLFPNWVGREQVRFIESIEAHRLILRTPPMVLAGKAGAGYLIWRRR